MKKIIPVIPLLVLTLFTKAQLLEVKSIKTDDRYTNPAFRYKKVKSENKPVKPIQFDLYQVDDKRFGQINNSQPGSEIAFYSERSGGKMIKKLTTDNQGVVTVDLKNGFNPAFALSVKSKTKSSTKGNGTTAWQSENIFTIRNIQIQTDAAGNNTISGQTEASISNLVVELHRKQAGKSDVVLQQPLEKGKPVSSFNFNDKPEGGVTYQLLIKNTEKKSSYFIKELKTPGQLLVKAYPTVTAGQLTIQFETPVTQANYQITDASGKIFLEGLVRINDQIDVSKLVKGVYHIKFTAAEGMATRQFVKQ